MWPVSAQRAVGPLEQWPGGGEIPSEPEPSPQPLVSLGPQLTRPLRGGQEAAQRQGESWAVEMEGQGQPLVAARPGWALRKCSSRN